MKTTELQSVTETKLTRIAWLSEREHDKRLECLMHLFNVESLEECYHMLEDQKAVGVDGVCKAEYGENLQENLTNLVSRMKSMSYVPKPVRQVLIPKEGKKGETRPLGISTFEDKVVQKMMQRVLEAMYDPIFLECSHGFRPGRGCHTAIKDLMNYLYDYKHPVETIIDVDLSNFFGTIDHEWLVKMLRHRIKDEKLIRYLIRMFKAGVMSKGDLYKSEDGVPQGSICSPVLANVFAHYVIDLWFEKKIKPRYKGAVHMVRYADDMVICCGNADDAQSIKTELGQRLAKFNLRLNEEKTKLVRFSRREAARGIKQESFDFLGFTFYWGTSKRGKTIPKLKTRKKSLRTKLKDFTQWIRKARNAIPLKALWVKYSQKLRGHYHYYGVSHNSVSLGIFQRRTLAIMFKWLNRRSQRKSFSWVSFLKFVKANPLPVQRIHHKLF